MRLARWLPSRSWLIVPPILIGIGIFVAFVISRQELETRDAMELEAKVPLQVLTVESGSLQPIAKGFGTVSPSRTWTAIAEVAGRIVETHQQLESGKPVVAGELLVRIDEFDYELRVSQRQSELDSALANQQELEASQTADEASLAIEIQLLKVNQSELKRLQQLKQQRAASTTELDAARGNLLRQTQSVQKLRNAVSLYPARIAAAKAAVEMARSRLKEADRDLTRTKIVSPFDGVVAGANLEVEQVVGKNEKLFQVQDVRIMEVNAQFSLAQLDKLAPSIVTQLADSDLPDDTSLLEGVSAELTVRSGSFVSRWQGRPIRIADSVDQQTRTLGIIVEVDNRTGRLPHDAEADEIDAGDQIAATSEEAQQGFPANQSLSTPLRAGTFCEITLLGPPLSNVIAIPRTAIDEDSVYVVEKIDRDNYRLRKRTVKIGFAMDDLVLIEDGLFPQEQIAIKPPVLAVEKLRIDPVNIKQTTPAAHVTDAGSNDR